jgi:hypothetical protein
MYMSQCWQHCCMLLILFVLYRFCMQSVNLGHSAACNPSVDRFPQLMLPGRHTIFQMQIYSSTKKGNSNKARGKRIVCHILYVFR